MLTRGLSYSQGQNVRIGVRIRIRVRIRVRVRLEKHKPSYSNGLPAKISIPVTKPPLQPIKFRAIVRVRVMVMVRVRVKAAFTAVENHSALV